MSKTTGEEKGRALIDAAAKGNCSHIAELLAAGADANSVYGQRALFTAISTKKIGCVRLLAEAAADINERAPSGWTPLHCATSKGSADIIRLLIETGADVNISDRGGNRPLHIITDNKNCSNAEGARLLIEAGADVDAKNNPGWTPILLAAEKGSIGYMKMLIQAGAYVNPMVWKILRESYPDRYEEYAGELTEFIAAVKKIKEEDSPKAADTGFEFDI